MQFLKSRSALSVVLIVSTGLMIFSSVAQPIHAQADNLNPVMAAYTDMAGWGSYTAQINGEHQLALVLASGDEHYQLLESWQRSFEGIYQPPRRAAEGQLSKIFQQREYVDTSPNAAPTSEVELNMAFDILGIDGRIYAEGRQTVIPEGSAENIYLPALTRLARDEVPNEVLRFVDYNTFRAMDDFLMVLNDSQLIVGPLLLEESDYGENLTVYAFELPPNAGITVMRIEVDSIFANEYIAENIYRDAFYDALADTASLVLRVYLTPAGVLIAEEVELTASLAIESTQNNKDRLRCVLKFQRQSLYQNINQAPAIQEP